MTSRSRCLQTEGHLLSVSINQRWLVFPNPIVLRINPIIPIIYQLIRTARVPGKIRQFGLLLGQLIGRGVIQLSDHSDAVKFFPDVEDIASDPLSQTISIWIEVSSDGQRQDCHVTYSGDAIIGIIWKERSFRYTLV